MCEWVDFSYSESPSGLTHPTKFLLNRIYGKEKMLFKEQKDVFLTIFSESQGCMMHPIKFLLKRIYGLKEVV